LHPEFKGALTEIFILQQILPLLDMHPRYWTDGRNRSVAAFTEKLVRPARNEKDYKSSSGLLTVWTYLSSLAFKPICL